MTENQVDQRIADLLTESSADGRTSEFPAVAPGNVVAAKALQTLLSAQRLVEERLLIAESEARRVIEEAQVAAARTMDDARDHAASVREKADLLVAESGATTAQAAHDADQAAEAASGDAELIVASATAVAEETVAEALRHTEELRRRAIGRHEDLVGELQTRRNALRRSRAALNRFDAGYRARLATMIEAGLVDLQPR